MSRRRPRHGPEATRRVLRPPRAAAAGTRRRHRVGSAAGRTAVRRHAGRPPQYPPQYGAPQYGRRSTAHPSTAAAIRPPPAYGQYGQYGGYQAEYKPGIVPLRPLGVGEILDGAFSTIRKHPRIVFGFAIVLAVIAELIRLGVGYAMNNVSGALGANSFSTNTTSTPEQNLHMLRTTLCDSALAGRARRQCLVRRGARGIVTGVVGQSHRRPTARRRRTLRAPSASAGSDCWSHRCSPNCCPTHRSRCPVIGALLGSVAPGLASLGGVIGGIAAVVLCPLLWGRLALTVPIFVLERRGPAASVARSWRLVRGAFWRTWGLRALVSSSWRRPSAALSVPLIVVLVGSANRDSLPPLSLVLLVLLGAIVWAVTQPLVAASLTLIYVDRRMRAEGLDIQLTRAAQAAAAPGPLRT